MLETIKPNDWVLLTFDDKKFTVKQVVKTKVKGDKIKLKFARNFFATKSSKIKAVTKVADTFDELFSDLKSVELAKGITKRKLNTDESTMRRLMRLIESGYMITDMAVADAKNTDGHQQVVVNRHIPFAELRAKLESKYKNVVVEERKDRPSALVSMSDGKNQLHCYVQHFDKRRIELKGFMSGVVDLKECTTVVFPDSFDFNQMRDISDVISPSSLNGAKYITNQDLVSFRAI